MTPNNLLQQVSHTFNHFSSNKNTSQWIYFNKIQHKKHSQTMESLIKQTRARFPSRQQENKEEASSTRERRTPLENSQSFREKRRSQSWIKRQFSRQMSSEYDHTGAEYPTAVAAAAFAIQTLEESKIQERKNRRNARRDRSSFNKSKEEESVNLPETRKSTLKYSDQSLKRSFKDPDIRDKVEINTRKMPQKKPSNKKNLVFADANETFPTQHEEAETETSPQRPLPLERPSTFADKHLNIAEDKRPESPALMPERPPTPLPRGQVQPREAIRQRSIKHVPADSQADAWEKEEIASIKERYEKMTDTIDVWETKKKAKAKRKIEQIEADLDKRRIKADSLSNIEEWEKKKAGLEKKRRNSVQSYRNEIKRIEAIAGGARTQAEENRRKEESKVRGKANKISATGKLPPTCFCF